MEEGVSSNISIEDEELYKRIHIQNGWEICEKCSGTGESSHGGPCCICDGKGMVR